jgi:UDP-N-acetylmuramoyl-tripeptide--D-alanyl-D-alanine ligase
MNHAGEISLLSRLAKPDIAVITNIGTAHIENLGSQTGIFHAKMEILDGLAEDGFVILNGDDEYLHNAKTGRGVIFYGFGENNAVRAVNIIKRGLKGTSFNCVIGMNNKHTVEFTVDVPVPGTHMVRNALAAAAVGYALGIGVTEIKEGIETFKPSGQRMMISENGDGVTLIDDVYNANPDSAAAALRVLAEAGGRKVCVLGDMLELGAHSEKYHSQTGLLAVELGIDLIVCTGELSRHTYNGAKESGRAVFFPSKRETLDYLKRTLKSGDTVLIKASRSMGFEEIVEPLK